MSWELVEGQIEGESEQRILVDASVRGNLDLQTPFPSVVPSNQTNYQQTSPNNDQERDDRRNLQLSIRGQVMERALSEGRVLITEDRDFG